MLFKPLIHDLNLQVGVISVYNERR